MIKAMKSLSNKTILDTSKNIIIKHYSNDEFQNYFTRQEFKILKKAKIKTKQINNNTIEIEYFKHAKFNDQEMNTEDLKMVAESLKELHSWDTTGIVTSNFKDPYLKLLLKNTVVDEMEKTIFSSSMKILKKGKQVILHNDVVEGNLLKINDKIMLIDFEYSGTGNPIFDLASFITERKITPEQIKYFVNAYDKNIDQNDLLIVSAFLQIFWHRWALYKYKISKEEIFNEIAKWKLEKYDLLVAQIKQSKIIHH